MSQSDAAAPARGHGVPGRPAVRELRAEAIRVAHWRRLTRSRLDLAVAALAVPGPLGGVPDALPDGAADALPDHLALIDAVSAGGPVGELDRLEALRDLDLRLARYERVVARALRDAVGGPAQRAAPDQA